jgi:stage II sporulation protein D
MRRQTSFLLWLGLLLSSLSAFADPTSNSLQISPAPAPTLQRRFYPLGYVPPPAGTEVTAPNNSHFYPLGYTPLTLQSHSLNLSVEKKAVALSLPKNPTVWSATASNASAVIKVGLALNISYVNLVVLDAVELKDSSTGMSLGVLPASTVWRINDDGTQLKFDLVESNLGVLLSNSDVQTSIIGDTVIHRESFAVPLRSQSNSDTAEKNTEGYTLECRAQEGLIGLNGKAYRGSLWLRMLDGQTFSAINVLNLEDYLLSVVPSEMPSSWPLEALKAQAIAARSYALANTGKHGSQGFDVKADTEDQMYTGVQAETLSGNQAVAQTTGIVIKNQGKVVPAFYHSTSGGSTETSWGKSYPFLQQVVDYDDASPKFTWTKKVPTWQMEQALRDRTQRYPIGQLQNVEVLSRSPSKILVTGSLGSMELSGDQARGAFGLPSSNFNVMLAGDSCIFSGRGFGHRMGLSQWGAKALAEHGYNAAQILSYYYKDVSLEYP